LLNPSPSSPTICPSSAKTDASRAVCFCTGS
jgi:hypothetical protein